MWLQQWGLQDSTCLQHKSFEQDVAVVNFISHIVMVIPSSLQSFPDWEKSTEKLSDRGNKKIEYFKFLKFKIL